MCTTESKAKPEGKDVSRPTHWRYLQNSRPQLPNINFKCVANSPFSSSNQFDCGIVRITLSKHNNKPSSIISWRCSPMCLLFVPVFPPSKSTKITKNHQSHQNLKNKNVPNKSLKLLKHLAKSAKISKKSQGFPVITRFWSTTRWRFSNPELKPTRRPALGSRHRPCPSPENMGYPGYHKLTMTPISGFTTFIS